MRQKAAALARPHDDKTLSTYRDLCETRLRRLERYKKTKSFCELSHSKATTSASCHNLSLPVPASPAEDQESTESSEESTLTILSADSIVLTKTPYELLREKMISLMENDVQLMQKLLTLATSIQELREKQPPNSSVSRSPSRTSLTSGDEEESEWEDLNERHGFSASISAITHLYVSDSDHGVEEEEENVKLDTRPQQYFSRKNSVLRIPIKPRASNRMLGRRLLRRPSEIVRVGTEPRVQPMPTVEDDEPLSCCTDRHCRQPDSRDSEASLDSGIRDDLDVAHA